MFEAFLHRVYTVQRVADAFVADVLCTMETRTHRKLGRRRHRKLKKWATKLGVPVEESYQEEFLAARALEERKARKRWLELLPPGEKWDHLPPGIDRARAKSLAAWNGGPYDDIRRPDLYLPLIWENTLRSQREDAAAELCDQREAEAAFAAARAGAFGEEHFAFGGVGGGSYGRSGDY